jgi:multiple sugar transport system permease protein
MLVAPVAVALVARQLVGNRPWGQSIQITTFFQFANLPFLTETKWALGSLVAVEIWQVIPPSLLLWAGFASLPEDVYEAAELENASRAGSSGCFVMLPISAVNLHSHR